MGKFQKHGWILSGQASYIHTRPVRKVSDHFKNLENQSGGLDATCQPVRGDLTAHA